MHIHHQLTIVEICNIIVLICSDVHICTKTSEHRRDRMIHKENILYTYTHINININLITL